MILDLSSVIAASVITGIVSATLNLTMSVARFINIGAGAIMALGAYIAYFISNWSHSGVLTTSGLVLLISSVVGYIFYLTINKIGLFDKVENIIEDMSVIISYGFHLLVTGSLSLLFGAKYTSVDMKLEIPLILSFMKETEFIIILLALIIISILHFVFVSNLTYFGLKSKSIIQSIQTAESYGINTKNVFAVTFTFSFAVLGLAGSLYALMYPLYPYFGLYYTVIGFIAAGVSGMGNVVLSFSIAVIISLFHSLLGLFIPLGIAIVISYVLMLALLVARPEGLKKGLR
jgi:branched-subunit amino acid ABC-type transport system permease component